VTHDVTNATAAHIHIGDPGVNGPGPGGELLFPETNLPPGTIVTFQGVAVDPNRASNKSASTTNAVIARIL